MIIYANGFGHMTNMAAMPIIVKAFSNLLLQNQKADYLEICYVAFTKVVQMISLG